jgi:hypothetical protein
MGVLGWLGLATIPDAALLLLLWLAWVGVTTFSLLRSSRR